MRILLVDHLSPVGHKTFDSIHIEALSKLGHELCLLGKSGQFDSYAEEGKFHIYSFPRWTYNIVPLRPLTERIFGLLRSLWLKQFVKREKYDAIILLSYDILSLFIFRVRGKIFLVNHNNVSQIDKSKIKLFLTRLLPNNYIHIALSEIMKKRMIDLLPGKKVEYVPHGVLNKNYLSKRPEFLNENQCFLFCPVNGNYDLETILNVLNSGEVKEYLKREKIELYIKKNLGPISESPYIKTINKYLSEEEYNFMIENSQAVILPYSKEFKYRCSGIFFECVAKNAVVLSTKIPDMLSYKDRTKIVFFDNPESFVHCLLSIDEMNHLYVDKESFNPQYHWQSILE